MKSYNVLKLLHVRQAFSRSLVMLAVLLLVLTSPSVFATTKTLDDFNEPEEPQTITITHYQGSGDYQAPDVSPIAAMFEGTRRLLLSPVFSRPLPWEPIEGAFMSLGVNEGGLGQFKLHTSEEVTALGVISYFGGDLNADLTSFTKLTLAGVSAPEPTTFTIELATFLVGNRLSSVLEISTPGMLLGDVEFDLGAFSPGVNLSDIDSIRVWIDPGLGDREVTINAFTATLRNSVPETANTLILLFIIVAGFGMVSNSGLGRRQFSL